MAITSDLIKTLREQTGVGILQAKQILEQVGGNLEKAVEELRKQGQKIAGKKQDRNAGEGWVGVYVHHNGKVASMVELRCETDFVARNEAFKQLANEIAMHISAANPLYVKEDEVPSEVVAKEEEIAREALRTEGKPEEMIAKIVPGKVQKYFSEVCLLKQPYFMDDKKTVADVITEATVKLGEKVEITKFSRFAF